MYYGMKWEFNYGTTEDYTKIRNAAVESIVPVEICGEPGDVVWCACLYALALCVRARTRVCACVRLSACCGQRRLLPSELAWYGVCAYKWLLTNCAQVARPHAALGRYSPRRYRATRYSWRLSARQQADPSCNASHVAARAGRNRESAGVV